MPEAVAVSTFCYGSVSSLFTIVDERLGRCLVIGQRFIADR